MDSSRIQRRDVKENYESIFTESSLGKTEKWSLKRKLVNLFTLFDALIA